MPAYITFLFSFNKYSLLINLLKYYNDNNEILTVSTTIISYKLNYTNKCQWKI